MLSSQNSIYASSITARQSSFDTSSSTSFLLSPVPVGLQGFENITSEALPKTRAFYIRRVGGKTYLFRRDNPSFGKVRVEPVHRKSGSDTSIVSPLFRKQLNIIEIISSEPFDATMQFSGTP